MSDEIVLCKKYEEVISWIGKRWTGLILRCLSFKPMRFKELARCVDACSEKVLTERLKELLELGLIELKDSHYTLTELGSKLNIALDGIQQFANNNL